MTSWTLNKKNKEKRAIKIKDYDVKRNYRNVGLYIESTGTEMVIINP